MNIYVSNLNHEVTDDMLRQAFASHGEVASAKIIVDQFTGYSRGFGFVEMPNDSEAGVALEKMNGVDMDGRAIYAKEARPKVDQKGSYAIRNEFKKS